MPNPSSNQGQGKAKGKNPAKGSKNQLQRAPAAKSRVRVSNGSDSARGQMTQGGRTVIFEEFVQDILSSSTTLAFSAESFPVQPGISTLFAWLADQAINYQEYRFKKLSFRYESEQSTALAGKVMFAFSPDAADPVPVNKQEMLEYGVKGKSAIWQEFEVPIPLREALGNRRYVRSGALAANLDLKTYDFGILFVASQGVVATGLPIGELYVKYELELMTPVVQSLAQAQSRGVRLVANTVAVASPFGTAAPTALGGLNVTFGTSTMTFNRVGNYIVQFNCTGTGLFTAFAIPAGTQTGLVATSITGISNAAANAGTSSVAVWSVVVSQRGATWATGTWAGVATTVTATVARIATYSEV